MTQRSTADWYQAFGEVEARGQSPIFEDWALGIARDPQVLALIDSLPLQKRQPNLIFACARLHGAPEGDYVAFRSWLVRNWPSVARETVHRMTQTNEPRRCSALLPVLGIIAAQTSRPLALLELGASAGLCLNPHRYSYRYGGGDWLHPADGESKVRIDVQVEGAIPIPQALPEVVWRAGIDLHPLDVRKEEDVRWLLTLIWPEQTERRERVSAAIDIARESPPPIVAGNAIDQLERMAASAPQGATLVVVTSAMLVYLPYLERMRLVAAIDALDAHWVSLDGVGVLPDVDAALPHPVRGQFTLSFDGTPLAEVGPHGQFVHWLSHPAASPQASHGPDVL